MNLEQTKQLAQEAAKSDFLWELGMRLPSANQARKVCEILSLSVAREKRIKAVMKLRQEYPNALLEIRDEPRAEEETEMPETVYGLEHFEKIYAAKSRELWKRIFQNNGIAVKEELEAVLNETFSGIAGYDMQRIQDSCPKLCGFMTGSMAYVSTPNVCCFGRNPNLFVSLDPYVPIKIRPIGHKFGEPDKPNPYRSPYFERFYLLKGGIFNENKWQHIGLFINDKKWLTIAKKIASAYERETKRRRSPAKAVVVKNY